METLKNHVKSLVFCQTGGRFGKRPDFFGIFWNSSLKDENDLADGGDL